MRERISANVKPKGSLRFLYYTRFGGMFLHVATSRFVSKVGGAFLKTRLSAAHVKKFVKKNGIDMSQYPERKYKSFNDFFTRKIKDGQRPFDFGADALCSPCDSKLTVLDITRERTFSVKGFDYSVETLLKNAELAEKFEGGKCLIFRLAVTDYHRYMFFDGGTREKSVFIKGRLHTVQPVALDRRRVFTENCREYTVLHTDNFGDAVQVEVGALMVGRISNNEIYEFSRGDEKGKFEFGGSTVILLLQNGVAKIDGEIEQNSADGFETVVKCGEKIGEKIS